jgi:CubicO group peptidase (beta-lactamase class C family)
MRSIGPAGLVCATASDVLGLARLHLDQGRAPDGSAVLDPTSVAEMQRPQVHMPYPHGMSDHWGLGWAIYDWDGRRVYGHDGDTIGQSASLRVVPDSGVAVALLANSDRAGALHDEVISGVLGELCDVAVPPPLQPPAEPPPVDPRRHAGVYERVGTRVEATVRDGALVLHVVPTGELADLMGPYDVRLVPLAENLFLGRAPQSTRWSACHFYSLPDGRDYLHNGSRATPRVA